MRRKLSLLLFALTGLVTAQGPPPPPQPLQPPQAPPGNPVTLAKTNLGKALFWDEQLSTHRTVSCGSCHQPAAGGSDGRSIIGASRSLGPGADGVFGDADDVVGSPGVPQRGADNLYVRSASYGLHEQVTGRKAITMINAAYAPAIFWDGRAGEVFTDPLSGQVVLTNGAALETQVLAPPVNSTEMAHIGRDWADVASRIAASRPLALARDVPVALQAWIGGRDYAALFAEAFGGGGVTPSRIAMAIATYERTLYSNQTPFDSDLAGIPSLTAQEARGRAVFGGPGGCVACHTGSLLSDNQFHNTGVRPVAEDQGRFIVTGANNDRGAFLTPTLRNGELRAPFMHNGRFASLEAVVDFYDRGGDFNPPNKDPRIHPLGLNPQQKADLVAFLKRPLTDPRVAAGAAPFDRPTLYGESNRVPQLGGAGVASAGGSVPAAVALEPPVTGNPAMTIGVEGGLGGALATLVIDTVQPAPGGPIPTQAAFVVRVTTLQGAGAGQGYGSVSLAIPDDQPALVGRPLYGRWYIADPGAPGGVAVSRLFTLGIFGDVRSSSAVRWNWSEMK